MLDGGSLQDIQIIEMATLLKMVRGEERSGIDLGRLAGEQLLRGAGRPHAIFAYNDELAAGIVTKARDLGIGVPNELCVAGFDDSDAARLCWPPLTTIRQAIVSIAARAVEILTIPSAWTRETIICPVELVERASSGRLKS
jgi:LacI family transcriptional regulator